MIRRMMNHDALADAHPHFVEIHTPTPPIWPDGQEPLARLACVPITEGTRLRFEPLDVPGQFVLATAFDKRGPCRLELAATQSVWTYRLDVSYCSLGRRYHIAVPPGVGEIAVQSLDDDGAYWALADAEHLPGGRPAVWPIVPGVDRLGRFFERLENDCIAEFGWMGGCVTEALDALGRQDALDRWLAHFLDDAHLHYQDARGNPLDDRFNTIEATLPIAAIARRQADHPIVDIAVKFLRGMAEKSATCEGCYTVAYPLAQVGQRRGDDALIDQASRELAHRRQLLCHEGDIYLRHPEPGRRTYRSWTRGVAWYLLGFAECFKIAGIEGRWAEMAEHIVERANWAIRYQRADGLWDNFFHEPELPPDTSGSAGIATALLILRDLGLLGDDALDAAERCWAAMPHHLHVDGWLGGTSPSNKRGEGPQHLPVRASETYGMGLMGRLTAEMRRVG